MACLRLGGGLREGSATGTKAAGVRGVVEFKLWGGLSHTTLKNHGTVNFAGNFHSSISPPLTTTTPRKAEEEFLQAGKPREAIDMFVHQKAWADACRVAEGHDPPAVPDVLCAQAADIAAAGDRAAAEDLYVRAGKPEKALQVFSLQ